MSLLTGRIFYEALKQDKELDKMVGGRIFSTAIEVPPAEEDNTPPPYIILMYGRLSNDQGSKDGYEGESDMIGISASINARSTDEVLDIAEKVRNTVLDYMNAVKDGMVESENAYLLPDDYAFSASGVEWNWEKPCYTITLFWDCDTKI